MKYIFTCLLVLFFGMELSGQLQSVNYKIIDDLPAMNPFNGGAKRNLNNPKQCAPDTVEYPRYKATRFFTVPISNGRSLGQFYSAPSPVTISGFTFFAFVATNPPSPKTVKIICSVYKAGLDSLPTGPALRSDTIQVDSTFGGGLLTRIQKRADFNSPVTLDSAYVLVVRNDSASNLPVGVVTNDWDSNDGNGENLNSASISNFWYTGRNLFINSIPFDADICLYPHVTYKLGTDFDVTSQCYDVNDTVYFKNKAYQNMTGSRIYNRYIQYGLDYYCNLWNYGDNFQQYIVDGKRKYFTKQNFKARLISTVYGYNGMGFCSDTAEKYAYFKPNIPAVNGPINVCIGDSAIFRAISLDTGVVFEWFKQGSTVPFFSGATLVRYNVTKGDTLQVRGNNRGCVSALRTYIYSANAYPNNPVTTNDSVCSGSRANLSASSNIGSILWYTTLTGGAPVYSGSIFQTPVLNADTTYYVAVNNNGCFNTGGRVPVKAMVGSLYAPQPPVISNDTIVCLSSTPSVTLTAIPQSGLSVRWFDAASGGGSIATGNQFIYYTSIRQERIFYADAYNGSCPSTRIGVKISIEDYPFAQSITNDIICKGDSAVLEVSIPFGDAHWYNSTSGGTLLYSGKRFVFTPSSSLSYFVEMQSGVCINPIRSEISVVVNTFATFDLLYGDTICAKNPAELRSSVAFGDVQWFDDIASATPVFTGYKFTTAPLTLGKMYWARSTHKGCDGPKLPVSVLVLNPPFPDFTYSILSNQRVEVEPANAIGATIKWDFGDGTTSVLSKVIHRYNSPGVYRIKLEVTGIANGCMDSSSNVVNIALSGVQKVSAFEYLSCYPNPVNSMLTVVFDSRHSAAGELNIYDASGRQIHSELLDIQNGHNQMFVDVAQLVSGVYFLEVAGAHLSFVKE